MRMDRIADRLDPISDFELVLRKVAHGARLLGLGWWVSLGFVTLVDGGAANPSWIVVSIVAALAWIATAVAVYRVDVSLATSRLMVTGDLLLAGFSLVSVTRPLADSAVSVYGGFPMLVVLVAAIRAKTQAWVTAVVLAVITGGLILAQAVEEPSVAQPISRIFVYVGGAFIATWAVGELRRSDAEIRLARDELARSEERARISAHLHDSVLQTLALIQKASDRSQQVVSLARAQERELRSWLYEDRADAPASFADNIRSGAADVEERYGVPIEVVTVGDAPGGQAIDALVGAAREAMVNAARHSGAEVVSVYAEVEEGTARIFVRDRGRGFSLDAVGEDRHGIRDSIRSRLDRHGGSATLRSDDRGTEWTLEVSR